MEINNRHLNNWLYIYYPQKPRHFLESGYDATEKWFRGLRWEMKWGILIKFFEFYEIQIADTGKLHTCDDVRGYDGYSYSIHHFVSQDKREYISLAPPDWCQTRDEAQMQCVETGFELLEEE